MLVLDPGAGVIDIFAGRAAGGFALTPTLQLSLTANSGAKAFTTGDFNGDGFPDIAVANTNLNSISVFLNTSTFGGSISFGAAKNSTDAFGGKPNGMPEEILTGFITDDGKASGRPVGVATDTKGALLVADDVGNVIWRVTAAK